GDPDGHIVVSMGGAVLTGLAP
ncbi:MAG: hypothetical protein RJB61_1232, partial [Actinomycetota bacterium]